MALVLRSPTESLVPPMAWVPTWGVLCWVSLSVPRLRVLRSESEISVAASVLVVPLPLLGVPVLAPPGELVLAPPGV